MNKKKIKSYDAKFKAKIALALYKGDSSILEICAKDKIPKTTVTEWHNKLVNEVESLFIPTHEKEKKVKLLKEELEVLHKIIGEITVENNFLKKKLSK